MNTKSHDTDDRLSRLVGTEDGRGRAWCFECADREIQQGGEEAFLLDLYAIDAVKRRCCQCNRRLGEVAG
jgi:hypothetical protein